MSEYTSKGQGALNTVLGAIGTAGATGILNGGLGGIFGGCGSGYGWGGNGCCSEQIPVNRYEAAQSARIAELETEVKLRDANTYTLGEMGKLRDYVDGRFAVVDAAICDQKVMNATVTSTMNCMANQIAALNGLTKLVVPNSSVCPGWGNVTVSIPTTTTGA